MRGSLKNYCCGGGGDGALFPFIPLRVVYPLVTALSKTNKRRTVSKRDDEDDDDYYYYSHWKE